MSSAIHTLLVDYGSGNIRSAAKALERAGFNVDISNNPNDVLAASSIVVPGQGHFGQVMRQFRHAGFEEPILEAVRRGTPLLGICVGLQMLFEGSEEATDTPGLGLLKGRVQRFKVPHPVPQMQWNTLEPIGDSPLMQGLPCNPFAYFVHSYYVGLDVDIHSGAISDYGVPFWSVVSQNNIHATQFHPEKSQSLGLDILKNFRLYVEQHLAQTSQP